MIPSFSLFAGVKEDCWSAEGVEDRRSYIYKHDWDHLFCIKSIKILVGQKIKKSTTHYILSMTIKEVGLSTEEFF